MSWYRYEPRRSSRVELMDLAEAEPQELWAVYRELERLNRGLGGHATSRYGFERLAPSGGALRILDVGCGGGELAPVTRRWAERTGRRVELVGIDDDADAVAYANAHHAGPGVRFERADLFEYEPSRAFDVVHMGITLHHFDDAGAARALRRMAELASRGVVVNDLQRGRVPFYGVQAVTAILRSPPYVRHDAPLSVNRGFTRAELGALVRAAGWSRVELRWRPMFRWCLMGGFAPAQ